MQKFDIVKIGEIKFKKLPKDLVKMGEAMKKLSGKKIVFDSVNGKEYSVFGEVCGTTPIFLKKHLKVVKKDLFDDLGNCCREGLPNSKEPQKFKCKCGFDMARELK